MRARGEPNQMEEMAVEPMIFSGVDFCLTWVPRELGRLFALSLGGIARSGWGESSPKEVFGGVDQ